MEPRGIWLVVMYVVAFTSAALSDHYTSREDNSLTTEEVRGLYRGLDDLVTPPCDTWELDYRDTCGILGPGSNALTFYIDGPSGDRFYHQYYFYAAPGGMWVTLLNIDPEAAYCAMIVYNHAGDTICPVVEGGQSTLQLSGELPALGWYFIIITTYGCGPWDDDTILVNISHPPPQYDLSVTGELPWVELYDAHPDTGVWVYFKIWDTGADPIPYINVDQSGFFPGFCDCEYEYVYPVSFSTYAGPGITCDSLQDMEFISFIDTFYMAGDQMVVTVGPERVMADYSDASEFWNVYVNIDPYNRIPETNEQNNCSLVANIGWYHHVHGVLGGHDWNWAGTNRGINDAIVYLRKGFTWSQTLTSFDEAYGDGYFEFWEARNELPNFFLETEMDLPGILEVRDDIHDCISYFRTDAYVDTNAYSDFIIFAPNWYPYLPIFDSVYNAGANGLFGIQDINEFLTNSLSTFDQLPFIRFRINEDESLYRIESGIPTVLLAYKFDPGLYYDRYVIHELAHVVHNHAVAPGLSVFPGCSNHFPGGSFEGEECAFIEAWAGFFSTLVPYPDPYVFLFPHCERINFQCLNESNIEVNDWLEFNVLGEGHLEEGAVVTFLYDLWDDYTPYGIDDGDALSEPFSRIYNAMQNVDTFFSILDFADAYIYWELYWNGDPDWEQRRDELCNMLVANKIDPDSGVVNCAGPYYVCGDANGDGSVSVGDAVFLMCYIFGNCENPQPPDPMEAGDANCDGTINVGDAVYIIDYIFRGGPEPCCP